MTINEAELRKLAELAIEGAGPDWYAEGDEGGLTIRFACGEVSAIVPKDRAFIQAASPTAILALLDQIAGQRTDSGLQGLTIEAKDRQVANVEAALTATQGVVEAQAKQITELTACVAAHQRSLCDHAKMRDANLVEVIPGAPFDGDLKELAHQFHLAALAGLPVTVSHNAASRLFIAMTTGAATPAQPIAPAADALYLIVYDDTDMRSLPVLGEKEARAAFERVGGKGYNAHLFVKVESNSRDDPHYTRNIAPVADVSAPNDERAAFERARATGQFTPVDSQYPLWLVTQLRWEGWEAHSAHAYARARAAAPVSGPSDAQSYRTGYGYGVRRAAQLMEDHNCLALAEMIRNLQSAAPVGKASIGDDVEFRRLAQAWSDAAGECWPSKTLECWVNMTAHIDARSPVAAPQPDVGAREPFTIDLEHGAYIKREMKTTGAVGWLLYNEPGLVRALQPFEIALVESALKSAAPESAEPSADTERLDFVLDRQAFILTVPESKTGRHAMYQLMEQDEDEDYQVISGEGEAFRTKREAIDAARLATSSAAKGASDV